MRRTCSGPECKRPEARGGLCWGHLKQRQRGQQLRPIADLTPKELVLEAGNDWLEAEEDQEYRAAEARFLRSCEVLMRSLGWRPPVAARVSTSEEMMELQLGLGFAGRERRRSGRR